MVMAACCSSVCLQCMNISFRKFLSVDALSAWSYVGTGTSELEKATTKVSVNANEMENKLEENKEEQQKENENEK